MLNVQFSDGSETEIIGYYGAPQDEAIWKNMGVVADSDARWKDYYNAQPVTVQPYLPTPA